MKRRRFIPSLLLFFLWLTQVQATVIRFETGLGSFDVKLFDQDVPTTVENFLDYVDSGSLDGTIVHRSIPGFVIQGGGYRSDFSNVSSQPPIPLETRHSNLRGTIAMARTNVHNSATSQWFINLVDNPFLDTSGGGRLWRSGW